MDFWIIHNDSITYIIIPACWRILIRRNLVAFWKFATRIFTVESFWTMFFASRLVASSDQDKPSISTAHDEEKFEPEYVEPTFPAPSIILFRMKLKWLLYTNFSKFLWYLKL